MHAVVVVAVVVVIVIVVLVLAVVVVAVAVAVVLVVVVVAVEGSSVVCAAFVHSTICDTFVHMHVRVMLVVIWEVSRSSVCQCCCTSGFAIARPEHRGCGARVVSSAFTEPWESV